MDRGAKITSRGLSSHRIGFYQLAYLALLALRAEEEAVRMGREESELSPRSSRQEAVWWGRTCTLTTCPLCIWRLRALTRVVLNHCSLCEWRKIVSAFTSLVFYSAVWDSAGTCTLYGHLDNWSARLVQKPWLPMRINTGASSVLLEY